MIKDLVCALDYSACAEWALALFVAAFATITYGTLKLSQDASDRFASIPLTDQAPLAEDAEEPRQ